MTQVVHCTEHGILSDRAPSGRERRESMRGDELLLCSFCGKSQADVEQIICGPAVYICNECVELCQEIIDDSIKDKVINEARKLAWLETYNTD